MADRSAIDALCDRYEIQNTIHLFCRGADRVDEELMLSCFHPDATIQQGDYTGGREQFARNVADNTSGHLVSTSHNISNMLIKLDGDTASSEAVLDVNVISRTDGGLVRGRISSRYLDRWRKDEGAWRITNHLVVNDWWSTQVVEQDPAVGQWLKDFPSGRRDREDLGYSYF